MRRHDVIRAQLRGHGSYLEIGVRHGSVYWNIPADLRVGVDPQFRGRRMRVWAPLARLKRAVRMTGSGVQLYQETSDRFFARRELAHVKYDCVLVDGMHTYDQAYRDVVNALDHLAVSGLIVMHDCNPQNPVEELPSYEEAVAHPNYAGTWSGTVWKAVVRLRTHDDLNVHVLDCDTGLGIVTSGEPELHLTYKPEEIAALTFTDLCGDRERLLGLRDPAPSSEGPDARSGPEP